MRYQPGQRTIATPYPSMGTASTGASRPRVGGSSYRLHFGTSHVLVTVASSAVPTCSTTAGSEGMAGGSSIEAAASPLFASSSAASPLSAMHEASERSARSTQPSSDLFTRPTVAQLAIDSARLRELHLRARLRGS